MQSIPKSGEARQPLRFLLAAARRCADRRMRRRLAVRRVDVEIERPDVEVVALELASPSAEVRVLSAGTGRAER